MNRTTSYFTTAFTPAMVRFRALIGSILVGVILTACATSPTGRHQLLLISPQNAIESSKEAYVETLKPLYKASKIDSDPALTKRVKTITGRIIAQAIKQDPKTADWDWDIKVIDEPETVNAWCMAGGKMALYTGLVNVIKPTDDELAQVIGHEISHALANHTAEKMSVAMASSLGLLGLSIAVDHSEYKALALGGAALAATVAIKLPNSRDAESKADKIGIELAARAGYNPNASVTLWQKMGATGGKQQPEFMSTHPAPESRQATLSALVPKMMPLYQANISRPVYAFK